MTDNEVIELLRGDSPLNKARQIFSSYSGIIEQGYQQGKPIGPIDMRRLEFEAVQKIREIFEKE